MPIPDHLDRFIELNTAGRVAMLCRTQGVFDGWRIAVCSRAVLEAVKTWALEQDPTAAEVNAYLNIQLEMLTVALKRPPPPRLPRPAADPPPPPPQDPRPTQRAAAPELPQAKSMTEKLEEARKPLRRILQDDCVRLALLTPERANQLSMQLPGKTRETAEAELVAELRNNLHQQIRGYMRNNHGGPWNSPQVQNEVRLDIARTNSLHSVVCLTRQLLREFRAWESRYKQGRLGNLLQGRIRIGSGPREKRS